MEEEMRMRREGKGREGEGERRCRTKRCEREIGTKWRRERWETFDVVRRK